MPAPKVLSGLPKPILFGLYGAIGGLLGAVLVGEPAWWLLKPPEATQPPQLAVGASESVKVYPGTKNTFVVRIARERFDGPVAVKFGNLPTGISLPAVTIAPGETQIEATVVVGPDVPTGTTKVTFDADAEKGTLTASGSLTVEVIAPPTALGIAVPSNLPVYARGTGKFTASVARRSYDGEVSIVVDPLPPGVTVTPNPTLVPSGKSDVEITLNAAETTPIGITKLTVTARTSDGGTKMDAATQLDVQPSPIAPVDVMFVLDVTGSMGWAIKGVRDGIGQFAAKMKENKIDYQIGLLAFRDKTVVGDPNPFNLLKFKGEPFTTDVDDFRNQVGRLVAMGGGDVPESSLEAVTLACQQPFRKGATKILLLITDAPPKVKQKQGVPQTDAEELAGAKTVAEVVKAQAIDAVHLVVREDDFATYRPLMDAGLVKGGGKFFDLRTVASGKVGFESVLNDLSRLAAEAAKAKTSAGKQPEPAEAVKSEWVQVPCLSSRGALLPLLGQFPVVGVWASLFGG